MKLAAKRQNIVRGFSTSSDADFESKRPRIWRVRGLDATGGGNPEAGFHGNGRSGGNCRCHDRRADRD